MLLLSKHVRFCLQISYYILFIIDEFSFIAWHIHVQDTLLIIDGNFRVAFSLYIIVIGKYLNLILND